MSKIKIAIDISIGASVIEYVNKISNTAGTSTLAFSGVNEFKAQSFTAPASGNFGRFGFQVWKTGSPTGTLTAGLYSMSGTAISSLIASSTTTYDVTTLGTSDPAEINLYFNFPATAVVNATKYAILVTGTSMVVDGVSNYLIFKRSTGDVYAGGAYIVGNKPVSGQTEDASSRDLNFSVDYR